jgi:hypothetical protein
LNGSTFYYWQVRAVNGGGTMEANGGVWWNFKTTSCYSLTTSVSPGGSGTVAAVPAANCAGGKYYSGTVVQLTATPNPGYTFGSWSGSIISPSNPVSITMSGGNKTVTGNVTP